MSDPARTPLTAQVAKTEDGGILYIFAGPPSAGGAHPRRVGLVADDGHLSAFMICRGDSNKDEFFDLTGKDIKAQFARIASFLEAGQ